VRYVVVRTGSFLSLLIHLPRCKAVKFIEQGHVRVGPDTIIDPAFLVTRYFSPICHVT
jgi:hypothetical protein